MIYTDLTERAMVLAYRAHEGQLDKAGIPYIFHPYHLAEQMDTEAAVCVALLHDVVEDSAVTMSEIAAAFPPEIAEAVRLLTHDKETPYLDYIRTLRTNPLARKVKLADLAHKAACAMQWQTSPHWYANAAPNMRRHKPFYWKRTLNRRNRNEAIYCRCFYKHTLSWQSGGSLRDGRMAK